VGVRIAIGRTNPSDRGGSERAPRFESDYRSCGCGKAFKVHLDDYMTGRQPKSAREECAYFNDDGVLVAYRLAVILH
jgi:hypothetical protein